MKREKIYLRVILSLFLTVITWGIFCPMLISSAADIGVLFGCILVFAVPVFDYWILRPIFIKKKP